MSNYWSLHCKTCNVESDTNINRGDHILRGMVKAYPHLKAAQRADESGYLEFHVMSYGTGLFSFLQEHDGHEIDLTDEHGKFEPVEALKKNVSQSLTYTKFLECLDKAKYEMRQVHAQPSIERHSCSC